MITTKITSTDFFFSASTRLAHRKRAKWGWRRFKTFLPSRVCAVSHFSGLYSFAKLRQARSDMIFTRRPCDWETFESWRTYWGSVEKRQQHTDLEHRLCNQKHGSTQVLYLVNQSAEQANSETNTKLSIPGNWRFHGASQSIKSLFGSNLTSLSLSRSRTGWRCA